MVNIYIKNQGVYDAPLNFIDDDPPDLPAGFTVIESYDEAYWELVDSADGHKRVLHLHDTITNKSEINYTISEGVSAYGTVEWWERVSNTTHVTVVELRNSSSGNLVVELRLSAGVWKHNAVPIANVDAPIADTWHHCRIDFETTGGSYQGLAINTCKHYVDQVAGDQVALSNNESVDRIDLESDSFIGGNPQQNYIDAIGYTWHTDTYTIGDNILLIPEVDITAKTADFIIDYPLKGSPSADALIFNQPIDYDDIIRVTGIRTSYLNSRIDQNGDIYKGTYNFRDDTVGDIAIAGDLDFIDVLVLPNNCTCTLLDKFNEHSRVLQLTHDGGAGDPYIDHLFPGGSETDGIREFWWGISNNSHATELYFLRSAVFGLTLAIVSGNFKYRNLAGAYIDTGIAATNNTLFHHKIVFDVAPDTFNWTITDKDGVELYAGVGLEFRNAVTFIDRIRLVCVTNAVFSTYLDTFENPANSDYTVGDNLNLEVSLTNQVLFEGRVTEESSKYEKRVVFRALSIEGEEIHPGEEGTPYEPDGYSGITSNFTEEVIAESINVNCSLITASLTDEYYRGTYAFENDSNATTPMGVLDTSEGAGTMEVLTASLGSHKNYIHIDHADADHGAFTIYFESQTSGVIEWYVRTSNVGTGQTDMVFFDSNGAFKIALLIQGSRHKWYDGVVLTTGSIAATNIWYQYRLSFDCATDTFSLWVDGNLEADGADFTAVSADITFLRFEASHDIGNPTFDSYFDAFGFSWDKFYTAASDPTDLDTYQNSHIYIYGIEGGVKTVDFTLQGEHNIESIANVATDLEVYLWKYSPTHAWLFDPGTFDNQITLTKYCANVTGKKFIERFNAIITKGGFLAGSRVYGGADDPDAQTTYGKKTLTRLYTAVDEGTTPLNTIAASILTLQGNVPQVVKLKHRNLSLGMFAVGEVITVPADTIFYMDNNTYIPAGSWIISRLQYNCITDENIMTLVSSLFFMYNSNLVKELEALINS